MTESLNYKSNARLMMFSAGLAVTVAACAAGLKPGDSTSPSSKPLPPILFQNWPQKAPDVAIILSGEQHSFFKFCGCSQPQLGGFERRFNFIAKLKEKGWPFAAIDLGDLISRDAKQPRVQAQTFLKYAMSMQALNLLGYSAIGLGEQEFNLPLWEGLSRYTLQKPDANPKVLSANLSESQRNIQFPAPDGNGSMIKDTVVISEKGQPTIGVVAVVGPTVAQQIHEKNLTFENNKVVIEKSLAKFDKENVSIRVLLYHGVLEEARKIVKDFPKFQIVMCRSVDDEGPAQPTMVGNSMIIQLGQKGRYVGVVGVFKTGRENPAFDLMYQKVAMGEEYETDDNKVKDHKIIQILEDYSRQVRDSNLLSQYPRVQHPMQVDMPRERVTFVGSEACKACHEADYAKWKDSKHSHAFEALEKYAKKPSLRQFDGECIVCHTIGFQYEHGYVDETRTPKLKNVGCENCHGPGSLHVANPNNKALYKYLSPWKGGDPNARLGEPDKYNQNVLNAVDAICQKCHDPENDPKFRFEKFWPKIDHGKKALTAASKTSKSK